MKSTTRSLRRPVSILLSVALVTGTTLAGCGGTGTSPVPSLTPASATKAASGRAVVTIQWPTAPPSRLIPEATNLIHLDVLRTIGGVPTLVGSGEAVRPTGGTTSVIEVGNLPIDTLTVVATAYPGTDPLNRGVAVAAGSVPVTTQDNQVVGFSLTLSSTIDHLSLGPGTTVGLGAQRQMRATAWNGPDETTASVVLLSPGKLTWQSSDEAIVSVDSDGVIRGGMLGTATLTVGDTESGKSAAATITVKSAPTDAVGPAQFNPNGPSYAGTTSVEDGSGSWTATGDDYSVNTSEDPPVLRNTTKKTVVATGKLIGGYAVFNFPGDIHITKSFVYTSGASPLVLLTQGNFTLDEKAIILVGAYGDGPGAGQLSGVRGDASAQYGGGSFGGLGGGPTNATYGDPFPNPLQGGAKGYGYESNAPGGGAIYVGAVGTIKTSNASIIAYGADVPLYRSTNHLSDIPYYWGYPGGGGSGGGIALFGGGGVTLSGYSRASGGIGKDGTNAGSGGVTGGVIGKGYGGGGGRVILGYGPGAPVADLGFIEVVGGKGPQGRDGSPGVKTSVPFAGF